MPSLSILALPGVDRVPSRDHARIAKQLDRYLARHRPRLVALAKRDARLADLALSFPALLFALAVPRPGFAPEPVVAQVLAGAPLKQLGRLAGLPMWSRRLPPEAFAAPLSHLPDGGETACRIGNHLPRSPKHATTWLDAVSHLATGATPDAAVWIAREMLREPKAIKPKRLDLVALYVWHSGRADTLAGSLIATRWEPTMSFGTTLAHADAWREALVLHACLAARPVENIWLVPGCHDGYEFHPLRTVDDIDAEAAAMQHCLRRYADSIAHDSARMWSVRRDGERIATLQVGRCYRSPLLDIVQLRGVRNADVGRDVWLAAMRWIAAHDLVAIDPKPVAWGSMPPARATWFALWRPYWLDRRRIPAWLPLAPSFDALWSL